MRKIGGAFTGFFDALQSSLKNSGPSFFLLIEMKYGDMESK